LESAAYTEMYISISKGCNDVSIALRSKALVAQLKTAENVISSTDYPTSCRRGWNIHCFMPHDIDGYFRIRRVSAKCLVTHAPPKSRGG
jgi:hypothetical protein